MRKERKLEAGELPVRTEYRLSQKPFRVRLSQIKFSKSILSKRNVYNPSTVPVGRTKLGCPKGPNPKAKLTIYELM